MQPPTSPASQKVGLTLAAIQLFFTLTWTVYVIFLPQLAAQVGIAKEAVLLILLMDQLIFLVADTAMGVAADKSVRVFGRLGRWVVIVTLLSCAAFLLLPLVAAQGAGGAVAVSGVHRGLVCHLVCLASAAAGAAGQVREGVIHSLAGQSFFLRPGCGRLRFQALRWRWRRLALCGLSAV